MLSSKFTNVLKSLVRLHIGLCVFSVSTFAEPNRVAVRIFSHPVGNTYQHNSVEHYQIDENGNWKLALIEGDTAIGGRPIIYPEGHPGLPKSVTEQLNKLLHPQSGFTLPNQNGEFELITMKRFTLDNTPPSKELGIRVLYDEHMSIEQIKIDLNEVPNRVEPIPGSFVMGYPLAQRKKNGLQWSFPAQSEQSKHRMEHGKIAPHKLKHLEPLLKQYDKFKPWQESLRTEVYEKILLEIGGESIGLAYMSFTNLEAFTEESFVRWLKTQMLTAQNPVELRALVIGKEEGVVLPGKIQYQREQPLIVTDSQSPILIPDPIMRQYRQKLGGGGPQMLDHNGVGLTLSYFLADTSSESPSFHWIGNYLPGYKAVPATEQTKFFSLPRQLQIFDLKHPTPQDCKAIYQSVVSPNTPND